MDYKNCYAGKDCIVCWMGYLYLALIRGILSFSVKEASSYDLRFTFASPFLD